MISLQPQKIRQKAYQLGFALCGFTNDFVPRQKEYFLRWVEAKRFAEMRWLGDNTDKRLRPDTLLAGTKSVLVLGCSYGHETAQKDYKLARYAHGQDYHVWMKQKLEALALWIQAEIDPQFLWRSFVDTGPVLERDLAQKAGLGWTGKNTNLLSHEVGSYVFLGVIFGNLALPNDAPAPDQCGACNLCVEACPTQALTPYQLEPAKCLAYHNIEKRGVREKVYWQALADRLVGCDICQEVCPVNQNASALADAAWLASFAKHDLGDLKNILQISADDYKRLTKQSAIARVKYADFMRNVFLVIANTNRRDLLPDVLRWQSRHADLNLEECQWCLEKIA